MNREGKGKIEYLDYTWNPITGCLHGCEYCYARRIASRFGGASETHYNECVGEECQWCTEETGDTHDLTEPVFDCDRGHNAPYPFGFAPTFPRSRLDEPQKVKKPSIIGVVFMGDLFGAWVPDEWIREVFDACERAPQHTYIFLTKNWLRACEYRYKENWWVGRTITHDEPCENENKNLYLCYGIPKSVEPVWEDHPNRFISIEPIHGPIPDLPYYAHKYGYKWVIVGAETGNCKGKVVPKREWIEKIVEDCKFRKVPLFMKNSLKDIWGAPLIQEWPEGMRI